MIEILVIIALSSSIGKIVRAKGLKAAGYQWTMVGLWFGFEILGAIAGAVLSVLFFGSSDQGQCMVYIFALACAALGGWLGYRRAQNAEPAPGFISTPNVIPLGATPPVVKPDDFAAQKAADQIQALQKQVDAGKLSIQEFEEKKAEILAKLG